jgi:hypothetical protein
MEFDFHQWQSDLTSLISTTLGEFRSNAEDDMEMFAVDCHPWNGAIVLAFLTHSEVKDAPFLSDAAEMAAWKNYDFGAGLTSWQPAFGIALRMRTVYEKAGENRFYVARQFFHGCGAAVAAKPVQHMLSKYRLANAFKITVPHPDTAEEYYSSK